MEWKLGWSQVEQGEDLSWGSTSRGSDRSQSMPLFNLAHKSEVVLLV